MSKPQGATAGVIPPVLPPDDDAMRYGPAARFIGVPEPTLRTLVFKRKIPHRRLSERIVVFSRAELAAWLEAHRVPVGGAK